MDDEDSEKKKGGSDTRKKVGKQKGGKNTSKKLIEVNTASHRTTVDYRNALRFNNYYETTGGGEVKEINTKSIKFWNGRTIYTAGKTNQILKEMEKYRMDIQGISETWWLENGEIKMNQGKSIIYSGKLEEDAKQEYMR